MKISYITRARMPTEKAHGFQIAKMCEAYARLGHEVTLIVPRRNNVIEEDVFSYYNIEPIFSVETINIPDTIRFSKWFPSFAYWFQAIFFLMALRHRPVAHNEIIMTRSADVAFWYSRTGHTVCCEIHDWPRSRVWFTTFLLRKVPFLITNSEGTRREVERHGLRVALAAPNGVDLENRVVTMSREEKRTEIGINSKDVVLMYIGALEAWKGYRTVLLASRDLPHVRTVIVGGKHDHVVELQKEFPNVLFLGQQPQRLIADYENIADILVIPNDPAFKKDQEFTSPIKLFSHLASGVPLVATDLPGIRAIAGDCVTYFDGSVPDLVRVIQGMVEQQAPVPEKIEKSLSVVKEYTWQNRATKIMEIVLTPT